VYEYRFMSRKKRSHRQVTSTIPHRVQRVIGMVSVKTIRHPKGFILIRQGQRISEEIIKQCEAEEIIEEIKANAMPGRNSVTTR
jgi:hypothetical protein